MLKNLVIVTLLIFFIIVILYWKKSASNIVGEEKQIVEVSVPNLSSNAIIGKELFEMNCAACHGKNAAGTQGVAPPLVHIIYEPNHHGDHSFILAVKNGVRGHHWPFGNMPPVAGVTDEQVKHIIRYVRELQRANGIF